MRIRFIRFFIVLFVLTLFSFCEDEIDEKGLPPYSEMEKLIRGKNDSRAVFKWDQYVDLLTKLSEGKFIVLRLNEMRKTFDGSKVVVGLRHDVDFNPFKALEMANIEKSLGFHATYFLLATSEYAGSFKNSNFMRAPGMEYLYKELHKTGAEIGIHNDLLAVMILYNMDPFLFNHEELSFYRSLRIPIYGTASHGSEIAKGTVPNYQIFSDFAKKDSVSYGDKKYPLGLHSLKEYKFLYEAYYIDFNIYLSDSGGRWNDPGGMAGIMKKLESSVPGDRIQILVHPDWWGKTNQ